MAVPTQASSAGSITVNITGAGSVMKEAVFTEVGTITVSRPAVDLIVSDPKDGKLNRIQQPGAVAVVKVNLKMPLTAECADAALAWRKLWNEGHAKAKATVSLRVKNAAGDVDYGYQLFGAVPTEVKIAGMKAGGGNVGDIDITISADDIQVIPKG